MKMNIFVCPLCSNTPPQWHKRKKEKGKKKKKLSCLTLLLAVRIGQTHQGTELNKSRPGKHLSEGVSDIVMGSNIV